LILSKRFIRESYIGWVIGWIAWMDWLVYGIGMVLS
jgi:hypothetical protein